MVVRSRSILAIRGKGRKQRDLLGDLDIDERIIFINKSIINYKNEGI